MATIITRKRQCEVCNDDAVFKIGLAHYACSKHMQNVANEVAVITGRFLVSVDYVPKKERGSSPGNLAS